MSQAICTFNKVTVCHTGKCFVDKKIQCIAIVPFGWGMESAAVHSSSWSSDAFSYTITQAEKDECALVHDPCGTIPMLY